MSQPASKENAAPAQASTIQTQVTPTPTKQTVTPLQTYRGDIEKVVQGGASIVSMAAAEAERRSAEGTPAPAATPGNFSWKQLLYIAVGLLLLVAAGGVLMLVLTRDSAVPVTEAPQAPFIAVDDTKIAKVQGSLTRDSLMLALQAQKQQVNLALGLVAWLYPGIASSSGEVVGLGPQTFLKTLAPNVPLTLLRTLNGKYLLGVHSYDEKQAFLILQTDSYETAYNGMLEWERTLQGDLSPLFVRHPSPRGASLVDPNASTTPVFIPTSFVDKVVENRDTRVLLNEQGDILLLWTMLGRNVILITTNQASLREVISRMNQAPSIPAPR